MSHDRVVIISMRTRDLPVPPVPSQRRLCRDCLRFVWLSDATLEDADGRELETVCVRCFEAKAARQPQVLDALMPPEPGTLRALQGLGISARESVRLTAEIKRTARLTAAAMRYGGGTYGPGAN